MVLATQVPIEDVLGHGSCVFQCLCSDSVTKKGGYLKVLHIEKTEEALSEPPLQRDFSEDQKAEILFLCSL